MINNMLKRTCFDTIMNDQNRAGLSNTENGTEIAQIFH